MFLEFFCKCSIFVVLKRTVWKDKYEVTYVGPNQVLIKSLNAEGGGVVVRSNHGAQIEDVKIMGKDRYVVARTNETLLVGDLERNLISEVTLTTLSFIRLTVVRVPVWKIK